jgi:hypothetical protein
LVPDPANYAVIHDLVGNHSIETRRKVGAWRWPLVQKLRDPLLEALEGRALDFGGSAGPIGYGALIVDHEAPDKALYDVPGLFDLVFTSHTLEHVTDIFLCVQSLILKTRIGGTIAVVVPSWRNEKLRAENWPHHEHTFCLTAHSEAPDEYIRLDSLFALHCARLIGMDDATNILYAAKRLR